MLNCSVNPVGIVPAAGSARAGTAREAADRAADGGIGGADPESIATEMTAGRGSSGAMIVVSPGRGSGRFRVSGVALLELPHSPQNIAPVGSIAAHIWHFTSLLPPSSPSVQRTH